MCQQHVDLSKWLTDFPMTHSKVMLDIVNKEAARMRETDNISELMKDHGLEMLRFLSTVAEIQNFLFIFQIFSIDSILVLY